ncbi:winged helix-turn-helix domain-containing protein [Dyadobacter psychrophilus]|uniref:Transcriptional regulatory protein, C terminal n=1 Tax=Dyadobacter psychrophilus TaxID=651661 RepID=A0A1T5C9D7_9BACT|nr:winged helix-turn-helix domain-containing protein [Dyadobacter psychrophilus]SKB55983.1 Transcriptional regulatory protein, C terminal [Dyadobacter psychrophilus]
MRLALSQALMNFGKISFLMFVIGLCILKTEALANNENFRFAEKANLALRRTAHLLLLKNGDSLSTIPPVKQIDANTFSIRMEHLFDYEQLPELLKQSLQMQHIERGYNVTVLKCDNGEVQLGYNFLDLNRKEGVTCGGRTQKEDCYRLQVSFISENEEPKTASGNWWLLPFGSALAGLGFIVWNRTRHRNNVLPIQAPTANMGNDSKTSLGSSVFDLINQTLISGSVTHQLTFREAKLLALFARSPNQVLERDFILKSVWEDEGVIVGRSVDVFVSRLRKMLANEPAVKITAVHGVGYKMEVFS